MEISWGIWNVPVSEVGALPPVEGRDGVELGSATGYVSAWLARRGARPIVFDLSESQLATAKRKQAPRTSRSRTAGARKAWSSTSRTGIGSPRSNVTGFAVDALHELYAPTGAQQTRYEWVTPEWGRRWPHEEIWVATRTITSATS